MATKRDYYEVLGVPKNASAEDIKKNWELERSFEPQIGEEERKQRLAGWEKAVGRSFGWAKGEDA